MPIDIPLKKINEIVGVINSDHGAGYKLVDRFSTGEWGAYRIVESGKKSVVLKFYLDLQDTNIVDADPDLAKEITDQLRSLGYPAPKYLQSGRLYKKGLYWIQKELPGEPLRKNPTVAQVKKLLSFLKLQRNQAVSGKQNLSEFVKSVVFGGKFGKAEKLRNYSSETRKLLDRAMKLAEGAECLPLSNKDIVHGDFSYHQAMVENDRIVGIIDWQEAGCGDWLIDLTGLIYSLHDRPKLSAPVIKVLKNQDPRKIRLYTAYTVLEMVSWPVYRHGKEVSSGSINKAKSAIQFIKDFDF